MKNWRPKLSCMYRVLSYWDRVRVDIHDTRRFRVSCSKLCFVAPVRALHTHTHAHAHTPFTAQSSFVNFLFLLNYPVTSVHIGAEQHQT